MIPDRTDDLDRRTVLRASGAVVAASVVGLAGCAEPEDGGGTPGGDGGGVGDTPGDTPEDETPTPTPEDGGETPTPTPTPEDEDGGG